jgi:hypothetical protein
MAMTRDHRIRLAVRHLTGDARERAIMRLLTKGNKTKRSKWISVRVSKDEYKAIRNEASRKRSSVAMLLRVKLAS